MQISNLTGIHTLEVLRQRVAHGLAHMTREFGIQHFYSATSKLVLRRGGLREPNVWGISTGERSMVWAKLISGRGGL